MPFWLHEQGIVRAIKGLPLGRKIVAIITITIVIMSSWIAFFQFPLQQLLIQKQSDLSALAQQEAVFKKKTKNYDQLFFKYRQLSKELNNKIINSYSSQETMNSILKMMRKNGISCRGIQPQSITKKDFYEKCYFSINGQGHFKQILTFLHDLGKEKNPIKCREFKLYYHKKNILGFTMHIRSIRVFDNWKKI